MQTHAEAVAVFAGGVALAMLASGPELMHIAVRRRTTTTAAPVWWWWPWAWASTSRRPPSTRRRSLSAKARHAASFWILTAAVFVVFLLIPGWNDRVLQVEVGYLGASALLCALLYVLYRRPVKVHSPQSTVHSAES